MAKSKTKISKQTERKTNPELVETILAAKKNPSWREIASILSGSRKNRLNINLSDINRMSEDSKKVLVPGKILSQGELDKKIKVIALNFSEKAKEKLLNSGCEAISILEEIKSNPEVKGIKVLR